MRRYIIVTRTWFLCCRRSLIEGELIEFHRVNDNSYFFRGMCCSFEHVIEATHCREVSPLEALAGQSE